MDYQVIKDRSPSVKCRIKHLGKLENVKPVHIAIKEYLTNKQLNL